MLLDASWRFLIFTSKFEPAVFFYGHPSAGLFIILPFSHPNFPNLSALGGSYMCGFALVHVWMCIFAQFQIKSSFKLELSCRKNWVSKILGQVSRLLYVSNFELIFPNISLETLALLVRFYQAPAFLGNNGWWMQALPLLTKSTNQFRRCRCKENLQGTSVGCVYVWLQVFLWGVARATFGAGIYSHVFSWSPSGSRPFPVGKTAMAGYEIALGISP